MRYLCIFTLSTPVSCHVVHFGRQTSWPCHGLCCQGSLRTHVLPIRVMRGLPFRGRLMYHDLPQNSTRWGSACQPLVSDSFFSYKTSLCNVFNLVRASLLKKSTVITPDQLNGQALLYDILGLPFRATKGQCPSPHIIRCLLARNKRLVYFQQVRASTGGWSFDKLHSFKARDILDVPQAGLRSLPRRRSSDIRPSCHELVSFLLFSFSFASAL